MICYVLCNATLSIKSVRVENIVKVSTEFNKPHIIEESCFMNHLCIKHHFSFFQSCIRSKGELHAHICILD